jgi:hypothetical protein
MKLIMRFFYRNEERAVYLILLRQMWGARGALLNMEKADREQHNQANRSRSDNALKELQADGVDASSLSVDPMFVDPENDDFRLKPGISCAETGRCPLRHVFGRAMF